MAEWTYSRYALGHQRPIPESFRREVDEADKNDLQELVEACAEDDHRNHDGWEGGDQERPIHLHKDGVLHSSYTVDVEYEPVFHAQRAAAQQGTTP